MNKLIYILKEKEQKNKNKNIAHVLLYNDPSVLSDQHFSTYLQLHLFIYLRRLYFVIYTIYWKCCCFSKDKTHSSHKFTTNNSLDHDNCFMPQLRFKIHLLKVFKMAQSINLNFHHNLHLFLQKHQFYKTTSLLSQLHLNMSTYVHFQQKCFFF